MQILFLRVELDRLVIEVYIEWMYSLRQDQFYVEGNNVKKDDILLKSGRR